MKQTLNPSYEFLLRTILFVSTIFFVFVGVRPFTNNNITMSELLSRDGGSLHYILIVILGIIIGYLIWQKDREALKALNYPAHIAMIGWIIISVILSTEKSQSVKRLIILIICTAPYYMLFLLPRSRDHLIYMLCGIAYFLLFISYIGVFAFPMNSVHQTSDVIEQQLAGNWRGVFEHKNGAGPLMCLFIFLAVCMVFLKKFILGIPLFILSLIFLIMTEAKTATISFTFVFVSVSIGLFFKNKILRGVSLLATPIFLSIIGAGQHFSSFIANNVSALPIDTSFTGRVRVWQYVIDNIYKHPIFGFGYGAFWESQQVKTDRTELVEQGVWAMHAHQSYLDITLAIGIPGFIIFLWYCIYQPLNDIDKILKKQHNKPLLLMFSLFWAYALSIATMESIIFTGFSALWLILAFSLSAFRYLAVFEEEAA